MKQSLKIEIPYSIIALSGWIKEFLYKKYPDFILELDIKDEKSAFYLLMEDPRFSSFVSKKVGKYVVHCLSEYCGYDELGDFKVFDEVLNKSKKGRLILSKIQKKLEKGKISEAQEERALERDYIEYLRGKGYTVSQTGFSE